MTSAATEPFPSFANGRILAAGEPAIAADDQGFVLGLSAFETVLWSERTLWFVEDHIARLEGAAPGLGLAWPPPWDPLEAYRAVAERVGEREAALRMILSRGVPGRGPTLVVTPRAVVRPPDPGLVTVVASFTKDPDDPLERVKSTNRLRHVLAREEAERAGAYEALFADAAGDLVEGTLSNLFVVRDGALLTASVERGCLPGIVRAKLLAELEREPLALADGSVLAVRVDRVRDDDARAAEEAFLTNTTGRVLPIVELRGLGSEPVRYPGAAGPVTMALRARMGALERRYREGGNPGSPIH